VKHLHYQEKTSKLLTKKLVKEILNDPNLIDRVKLEDYLMVALQVRPCSILTSLAELPDGNELGKKIDETAHEDVISLREAADFETKRQLILKLREKLKKAYKDVVCTSPSYKAHMRWAKELDLRIREVEIRPTIHEFYLFKDKETEKKLEEIIKIKEDIREGAFRSPSPSTPRTYLIYPEDLSRDYVASLGELLGYPKCCVKEYMENRLSRTVNVEDRASSQIKEAKKKGDQPNFFAYFVRDFFPCEPSCKRAVQVGKQVYETFNKIDSRLGELYVECLKKNLETVENYPELIRKHEEKLREFKEKETSVQLSC